VFALILTADCLRTLSQSEPWTRSLKPSHSLRHLGIWIQHWI
jgi:hypothetical protein